MHACMYYYHYIILIKSQKFIIDSKRFLNEIKKRAIRKHETNFNVKLVQMNLN